MIAHRNVRLTIWSFDDGTVFQQHIHTLKYFKETFIFLSIFLRDDLLSVCDTHTHRPCFIPFTLSFQWNFNEFSHTMLKCSAQSIFTFLKMSHIISHQNIELFYVGCIFEWWFMLSKPILIINFCVVE